MTHLLTQDAFDCLCIRLSFSHWLSLLFPLVLTVPSILSSLTVREYCPHGLRSHRNCQAPCGAKIKTEQASGITTPSCALEDKPEAPENRLPGEGWGEQANRSGWPGRAICHSA